MKNNGNVLLVIINILALSIEHIKRKEIIVNDNITSNLIGEYKISDNLILLIENEYIYNYNFLEDTLELKEKTVLDKTNIAPISKAITLILCGENFLYYADKNFRLIGKNSISYDFLNGNELVSYPSLEVFNNNALIAFFTKKNKNVIGHLCLYALQIDDYQLNKIWGFDFVRYSKVPHDMTINCNFFENGNTKICTYYSEKNSTFLVGIINEDKLKVKNKILNVGSSRLEMIKVNENLVCIIQNYMSKVWFYGVSEKEILFEASSNLNFLPNRPQYLFGVKKDNKTLYLVNQQSSGIEVYMISRFGLETISSSFFIQAPNILELKATSFSNEGLGILIRHKNGLVKNIIYEPPICYDIETYFFLGEENIIFLSELSPDYEDLVIFSVKPSLGYVSISEGNKIKYHAKKNFTIIIDYVLADKENAEDHSRICRIIGSIHKSQGQLPMNLPHKTSSNGINCPTYMYPLEDELDKCVSASFLETGYYFDSERKIFAKCYPTCGKCNGKGTFSSHNCINCANSELKIDEGTKNCYCSTGYWIVEEEEIKCLSACPSNYLQVSETGECVENCSKHSKYKKQYLSNCVENCKPGTTEKDGECVFTSITQIVNNIDNLILDFHKNDIRYIDLNNSTCEIFEITKRVYQENHRKNVSMIDLNELKENITNTLGLTNFIVFKLDVYRENNPTNQVEYQFYQLDGTKIDFSVYDGSSINLTLPIKSDEISMDWVEKGKALNQMDIDICDSGSFFYINLCTSFTTKYNTDLILEDRKKYFFKNYSFCEQDCTYKEISFDDYKVICECKMKSNITSHKRRFSENPLHESFKKKNSYSNIKIIKCFLQMGRKCEKIYFFWIILIIFLLELVTFLRTIFLRNQFFSKLINEKATKKFSTDSFDSTPQNTSLKLQNSICKFDAKHISSFSNSPSPFPYSGEEGSFQKFQFNFMKGKIIKPLNSKRSEKAKNFLCLNQNKVSPKNSLIQRNSQQEKINYVRNYTPSDMFTVSGTFERRKQGGQLLNFLGKIVKKKPKKPKAKVDVSTLAIKTRGRALNNNLQKFFSLSENSSIRFRKYKDEDLNELKYFDSIEKDQRTFFGIYYSFLKYKQQIIFTFILKKDNNFRTLKVAVFFLIIVLIIGFNTILYTDRYFSRNYKVKGKYDFLFSCPKIFFSSFLSYIFIYSIQLLTVTQKNIQVIKREKNLSVMKEMMNYLKNNLKMRIAWFYILDLVLIVFFMYYVTAFCSVYINTQNHLMFDCLYSFLLYMVTPFLFCFFISIFRYLALVKRSEWLFNLSKMLQNF